MIKVHEKNSNNMFDYYSVQMNTKGERGNRYLQQTVCWRSSATSIAWVKAVKKTDKRHSPPTLFAFFQSK